MHPLALLPEDDEQLKGLAADVRDRVRHPGVELGGLTGPQKEILLAESEPQFAGEDVVS
jgi:hypothetical protein